MPASTSAGGECFAFFKQRGACVVGFGISLSGTVVDSRLLRLHKVQLKIDAYDAYHLYTVSWVVLLRLTQRKKGRKADVTITMYHRITVYTKV